MIGVIARMRDYRLVMLSFLVSMVVVAPVTAQAAPIPGMQVSLSLQAREQAADEFLNQLFGQMGVPVIVDKNISGKVNGDWNNTADIVYQEAMHSFQLVTYYDGVAAYVYRLKDMNQIVLPVGKTTATNIIALAKGMDLPDKNNRLSVAGNSGLVVAGTPRFIEQVKEISVSVRRNTKKYVPKMVEQLFKLKTSWAHDTTMEVAGKEVVVPGVVSILNNLIAGKPMETSTELLSSGAAQEVPRIGKSSGLMASSVSQTTTSAEPVLPKVPKVDMKDQDSEGVRIVAVPNLNAVLIRDYENRMKTYDTLIASLDVEPYMLEIEATIIDLNTDRSREIGVNWRLQSDDGNEALLGNGTASDQLLRPDTIITPQGQGGILSLTAGNQAEKFLARIRALEVEGDAEIISKPHVVTLSNAEAILDTTQTFFVRVASVDDASLFQITAGTTMRVTPHVYKADGDYRVKMKLQITDGATTEAQVDQIPVIGNSRILTQAIVNSGDSLLVGGLVRESKRDAVSKVPLLGDLPGLGNMFRSRSKSGNKVERMFLITPRIAHRDSTTELRMEAPIMQGQLDDVIKMSVHRGTEARASLETAVAARREPPRVFPDVSVKPQIAPLPKQPDLLVAGDGQQVNNGPDIRIVDDVKPKELTGNQLKALLRIPQARMPLVKSETNERVPAKQKWGVMAFTEEAPELEQAVQVPIPTTPAEQSMLRATKVSSVRQASSGPIRVPSQPLGDSLSDDAQWLEVGQ